MGSLRNWDFINRNVQSGLTTGQFLNMSSTLIAFGPPSLGVGGGVVMDDNAASPSVGDTVWPAGLVSQFGIQQQLPVIPVPEIGSYKRYTITGPPDGSFSLGRTLYHGPSLLRAAYAYLSARGNPSIPIDPLIDDGAANLLRNPHNKVTDAPGYENFWLNLASSVFTQPVGVLLFIQDSNGESYGAIYLENFQVNAHSFGTGVGQVVLGEQFSGTFMRCRAVKLATPIPLMSRISQQEAYNDSGIITVAGTSNTTPGRTRLPIPTSSNV